MKANIGAFAFLHCVFGASLRNDCDAGNAPWLSCITGGDGNTFSSSSLISDMNENTDWIDDAKVH